MNIVRVATRIVLVLMFSILAFMLFIGIIFSSGEKEVDYEKLGRNYNSLQFSDEQIKEIKANYVVLDSFFTLVSERLEVPLFNTGYVAYDTVFYYRHCHDSRGTFIEPSGCHLEKVLDEATIVRGNAAIKSMIRLGFNSIRYVSGFKRFILMVDTEYIDSRDYREILIQDEIDAAFLSKAGYDIIESKKGLTLLGQH